MRVRVSAGIRRAEERPRFPCTRPAGPSRSKAERRRQRWRSESLSASPASAIVNVPFKTLVRIQARRCSVTLIVIVSISGD